MDLDTLLHHYFGEDDPAALSPDALARAEEAIAIDFGVEQEAGRRFALWTLMHMLGIAPSPDDAFETRDAREAAWRFVRISDRMDRADD